MVVGNMSCTASSGIAVGVIDTTTELALLAQPADTTAAD